MYQDIVTNIENDGFSSEKHNSIIISVNNLSKSFGNKKILYGVSFDIKKNYSTSIIGISGSGKSLILKCITGLILPDDHTVVEIMGKDVTNIHISERSGKMSNIGVAFQSNALFDSMTVKENILFAREESLKNKNDNFISVDDLLEHVELSKDVANLYPAELSGGMQKRVAIARAMSNNPDILILDEPTAGLDPITSTKIGKTVSKMRTSIHCTIISISHDVSYVREVSDEVILIKDGFVGWHGSLQLAEKSSEEMMSAFFRSAV